MSGTPTETDSADPGSTGPDLVEEQLQAGTNERLAKTQRLRAEGIDPFACTNLDGRTPVQAIHAAHDPAQLTHGEHKEAAYNVAGRVIGRRGHGKTTFLDLRDGSGSIQLYAQLDTLGEEAYGHVLDLDVGDIVAANGCVYLTQRGQLALSVHQLTLLTKSLRTPPARYHGIEDMGTRYRYRELDLMANEETRDMFMLRVRTVEALRAFLAEHGFIEIETPMLLALAGGASSRPFITHHNALDAELSLRISMELYLNRCVIGGLENVYDFGKCFRNEGISYRHSPEFTLLEWMQSYADYNDVARLSEEMLAEVARRVLGTTKVKREGREIDLAVWARTSMQEVVQKVLGVDILDSDRKLLIEILRDHDEPIDSEATWGKAVQVIYSKLIEHTIVEPTFVYHFPLEQFPVTKRYSKHPQLAEHFDAVIGGIELVSGDSELADPVEQHERFVNQRRGRGDDAEVAHPNDEEYVRGLEYGLPPCASGGLGVDRYIMILSERETLRETLPFPTMKGPQ